MTAHHGLLILERKSSAHMHELVRAQMRSDMVTTSRKRFMSTMGRLVGVCEVGSFRGNFSFEIWCESLAHAMYIAQANDKSASTWPNQ